MSTHKQIDLEDLAGNPELQAEMRQKQAEFAASMPPDERNMALLGLKAMGLAPSDATGDEPELKPLIATYVFGITRGIAMERQRIIGLTETFTHNLLGAACPCGQGEEGHVVTH